MQPVADVVAPHADQPPGISESLSAIGGKPADRLGQYSWALFEFARSPYLSLVYIYVFAPYFANTVIGDPLRGQEVWSLANTLVGVFVALLAPLLGAVCDRTGGRKPWLLGIVAIMAPACMALWWAMPGAQGGFPLGVILAIIVVLATCFQFTDMFHSAMLPSLASPGRVGGLSGLGISVGNAGSLIALTVMLFGVALPASDVVDWAFLPERPLFGLDPVLHEHNRIAGPAAGIWMIIFVIPLMLWTPDRPSTGIPPRRAIQEGLGQLWLTVKRARQFANVGLYLVARTLYTDGKVAIIAYAGIYASGVFAWDLGAMLIFGLILTPFAIAGGLFGGWIDNRFGSKRAIQVSVGATFLGLVGAVSMTPHEILFFPYDAAAAGPVWSFPYFRTLPEIIYVATFMVLAATITAAFANSRAMMARISPISMMSQFFGLYGLAGTATAFIGHGLVATFTSAFQSQRAGLASTAILLASGLLLLQWVREERAEEIA
ncbi:MAG: MFS transporter [Gammaproteobacteria bacterium]|nr:MFS transporter [Gammaproteobacteria bacterium]